MRAKPTDATAAMGHSRVKAAFEALGWGAADNPPPHDLGTDLWVQPRDALGVDLAAVAGVQIKTGSSYFEGNAAIDDDGQAKGWWYYESDDDHFDYWVKFVVPHFLVLHHPEIQVSYWVVVTPQSVVKTGQGAKILVPKEQLICADQAAALVKAATRELQSSHEGSAWTTDDFVPDHDRLRIALVAPRLRAPHRNQQLVSLSFDRAIAMLTLMRLDDLEVSDGQSPTHPSLEDARTSSDWGWRLYAAFHDYVSDRHLDGLEASLETACAPHQTSAAAVMLAHAQIETGHPELALQAIEAGLGVAVDTVDRAWLMAQKARCSSDLGEVSQARELALEVRNLLVGRTDPTSKAVAAAAADIIFGASGWAGGDIGDFVRSSDTVTGWWRSQVTSWGLHERFSEDFDSWTGQVRGRHETSWRHLRAAALMASLGGSHTAWRIQMSLQAKWVILRGSDDPAALLRALDDLRVSGDFQALERTTRRMVDEGPVQLIRDLAESLNLEEATRTSIRADIGFVMRAADVIAVEAAERHARWALGVLTDLEKFESRYHPEFLVDYFVAQMLASLVPSLSTNVQREVINHVLALPVQDDQLVSREYSRGLRQIDPDLWTSNDIDQLDHRDDGPDAFPLREVTEELIAERDSDRRVALHEKIRNGSLTALTAFGDVRDLPGDVVEDLVAALVVRLRGLIDELRHGKSPMYSQDPGAALIMINAWHPDLADWDVVADLLAEPLAESFALSGVLPRIRGAVDRIPDEIRERLLRRVLVILDRPTAWQGLFGNNHAQAAVTAEALRAFSITESQLRILLQGSSYHRQAAIEIVGMRRDVRQLNLLIALTLDSDDTSSAAAVASVLVDWIREEVATDDAVPLLTRLLSTGGAGVACQVAKVIVGGELSTTLAPIVEELRDHASTAVRREIGAED